MDNVKSQIAVIGIDLCAYNRVGSIHLSDLDLDGPTVATIVNKLGFPGNYTLVRALDLWASIAVESNLFGILNNTLGTTLELVISEINSKLMAELVVNDVTTCEGALASAIELAGHCRADDIRNILKSNNARFLTDIPKDLYDSLVDTDYDDTVMGKLDSLSKVQRSHTILIGGTAAITIGLLVIILLFTIVR